MAEVSEIGEVFSGKFTGDREDFYRNTIKCVFCQWKEGGWDDDKIRTFFPAVAEKFVNRGDGRDGFKSKKAGLLTKSGEGAL